MTNRIIFSVIFFFSVLIQNSCSAKTADLAGLWYSSSPAVLKSELEGYLENAHPPEIEGKPIGFISPHAGFRYSGPVAAYTYKAAASVDPDTVIIVGFAHRSSMSGISVFMDDSFTTPLGTTMIDKELSKKIMEYNSSIIGDYPALFRQEQSVEMEIPFVQLTMKKAKLVLVSMGEESMENVKILAEALYQSLKDRTGYVMIASTDMSHYRPYDEAVSRDSETIKIIEKMDPELLYAKSWEQKHELLCGYATVSAVMMASRKLGADKVVVLKYANSSDTSGPKDSVVGYVSAAFVSSGDASAGTGVSDAAEPVKKREEGDMLSRDQRKELLKIARDAINYYLENGKKLEVKSGDKVLNSEMGAFVTLHKKGTLRGCIGNMVGRGPLYLTVRDMAIAAAVEDPRFPPVTKDEMKDIDMEISVLSPMEKIDDYNMIEMGKHGVMVRSGWRSGVYLPQVATETGWDRDQFMNSLCAHKAGIQPDAWKTGGCDIYVFTAEVFGEKENE
jgi:AmmeMemoRadiSam system protein B/AmmeMemoRadiSam system protein A